MKSDIEDKALKYAKKFINKVETGKARSKETYADMQDLVSVIEKNRKCTCDEDKMRMAAGASMTTWYCKSCGHKGLACSTRTPDLCNTCATRGGVCGYCRRQIV